MASITSLTSNSSGTSSLYGNKNIISGLASGMDTESMIENSVSGYKTKISSLQQKMTKLQWKQDAYRSIIGQMSSLLNKYTSYTSSTNLAGPAFFNSAVKTIANGANAAKVSATGKGTSDVAINAIKQMATAASYTVGTKNLVENASKTAKMDLNSKIDVSKVSGSLSFQIGGLSGTGGTSFSIRFDEDEVFDNAQDFADAINKKLSEKNVSSSGGTAHTADYYMKAEVNADGGITFKEVEGRGGNGLIMTGGSGDIAEFFQAKEKDDNGEEKISYSMESTKKHITKSALVDTKTPKEYLEGKSITVTLDGKSQKFSFDDIFGNNSSMTSQGFASALQDKINKAFGENKVKVSLGDQGQLEFSGVAAGSTFKVNGSNSKVNEILGLGEGGYSNTMQTGWSVEKALGSGVNWTAKKNEDGKFVDADGKVVDHEKDAAKVATLTINDVDIEVNSTDTIQNVMDKINNNKEAGVTVKFSALTGRFSLTANETGADSRVDIGGDVGKALFGGDPSKKVSSNFNEAFGTHMETEPGESMVLTFGIPGMHATFTVTASMTTEDVALRINKALYGDGYPDKITQLSNGYAQVNKYTGELEVFDKNGEKFDLTVTSKEYGFDYNQKSESGITYTAGQDAIFNVTVNGETMDLKRSSNTVDLDGLKVTLKGTFGYDASGKIDPTAEAITFTNQSDSDKIVDAIKSFVEDYNKLATELHNAYSTMPLQTSNGRYYEPLTEEEAAKNTESYNKSYEEKAKTGLLFGDSDLSNLYTKLTQAVQGSGAVSQALRSIGLEVSYAQSGGLSTITLDETKLREALDSDPDKVKNAFTQTTSNGASVNGIMANLKSTLEQYGSTSIAHPGILVNKAGTELSSYSLSHNELNEQINNLQKEIDKWQEKMGDKIDFYTNQFTRLELLINQMNSQSSMLSGLSGGY